MTMFKKTDPNPLLDIFTTPSMQLGSLASKKYSDPNAWFYSLVTTKIDEEIFKPLFPEGKKSGRPNACYFEDKDIKAYQLRKQIESLPLEEQHKTE